MAKDKPPVDNSKHYRSTGMPLKDQMYNRVVDRYGKKGNEWKSSDTFVWVGSIYELPGILSYIIQLLFFWWLAMVAIKYRGDGDPIYGAILILIFLLIRFGMILKQLVASRKQLEKIGQGF